jgi:hypothetical protein
MEPSIPRRHNTSSKLRTSILFRASKVARRYQEFLSIWMWIPSQVGEPVEITLFIPRCVSIKTAPFSRTTPSGKGAK